MDEEQEQREPKCSCYNRDLSEYDICHNCKYYIGAGDGGLFCSHKDLHDHLGQFSDEPCNLYEKKRGRMMNNQEAIKILSQYDVSDLHFYTTDGEEIPFAEWSDALELAIFAIEKQIPKNPIVNGDRNKEWLEDALICPVCNQYVGSVYNVGYCKTCGQKLIQKRISVV